MEAINTTNLTQVDQLDFSQFTSTVIAIGVGHLLLVVIPTLILGPLILGVFISNKKLRDPVSILFMCITVVCVLGPLTYGLLLDLSLITDFPLLGPCETIRGRPFWSSLYFFQILQVTSSASLIVVQHITVRWGQFKLSIRGAINIFIAIFLLVLTMSLPNWLSIIDTSTITVTIRESLCFSSSTPLSFMLFLVNALSAITLLATSYTIILLFSILTVKYVKKHTIDNKKAVRDVLIIMVALTTSVIIFRLIPIFRFVAQPSLSFDEEAAVSAWATDFSSDVSYPLFLLLTLFVHKTVRTTVFRALKCSNVKKVFGKRSNRIGPSLNAAL